MIINCYGTPYHNKNAVEISIPRGNHPHPRRLSVLRHHIGDLLAEYLYNFGTAARPLGSYSLNVRVAGHLYDTEALKQNNGLKKCSASVTADICAKFRADMTATENEMAMGSFSGRGKEEEETGTASLQDEVNHVSACRNVSKATTIYKCFSLVWKRIDTHLQHCGMMWKLSLLILFLALYDCSALHYFQLLYCEFRAVHQHHNLIWCYDSIYECILGSSFSIGKFFNVRGLEQDEDGACVSI